jgi:hypothetical protein
MKKIALFLLILVMGLFGQVTLSGQVTPIPYNIQGNNLPSAINNNFSNVPQKFLGTDAPTSVTGNLPGDFFTDSNHHNEYICNAPSGTPAPACTAVEITGWLLLKNSILTIAFNPNTATLLTCSASSIGSWFQASTALTGASTINTVTCPVISGTAVIVNFSVLQGSTVYGFTLPSPFNYCDFTNMTVGDTMTQSGTWDGTNYLNTTCTLKSGSGNVVIAVAPGVGLCHFAGSTQVCTSSAVNLAGGPNEVTGILPVGNLPIIHAQCTESWRGSGTSFALTTGDDAIANNRGCYNDSGATWTITAIKCNSDYASNGVTVNPTFGTDGTGETILTGALTCGNSYAYSSTGTLDTGAHIAWTTGTGIRPVMGGTLTGSTSIGLLVEYSYQSY